MDRKISQLTTSCAFCILTTLSYVCGEYCAGYGHTCADYQKCCGQTCCIPTDLEEHYHAHLRWSVWNMWYFWFVVLFVLMSCFGGCSYYRRHQLLMARQQSMIGTGDTAAHGYSGWRFPPAFPVSLFAGYSTTATRGGHRTVTSPGPAATSGAENAAVTQAMAFPTPPPYSEVMSAPGAYPANKDTELPPYPGLGYTDAPTLPAYSSATVCPQLPPYSPREAPQDPSEAPGPESRGPSNIPRSNVVHLPPPSTGNERSDADR